MGIENIVCTPEMPQFADDLMDEINHLYNIGAGVLVLNHLKELFLKGSIKITNGIIWKIIWLKENCRNTKQKE